MSSVLKALKKLEEERRGDAAASGAAAGQKWASGGQPERRPRYLLLAIAGLAVGLLVVLVLLWPRGSEPPVAVVAPPAATVLPAVAAPAAVPQPVSPPVAVDRPAVVATPQPARVEPVRPAAAVTPTPVVAIPEPRQTPEPTPPPAPLPEAIDLAASRPLPVAPPVREPARPVRTEAPVRQVQINRFDIPSPGQQWVAPPQLKVSEIFPPTGGERMAIVNGLPVMVGTMVDEAMVEEIHDDRVIVSIGGKQVAIPLQKGR